MQRLQKLAVGARTGEALVMKRSSSLPSRWLIGSAVDVCVVCSGVVRLVGKKHVGDRRMRGNKPGSLALRLNVACMPWV